MNGKEVPDFINLDIQGVELQAIMSLGVLIDQVNVIYTEVNKRQVYVGCNLIQDIDAYLKKYGFRRIATRWQRRSGWGDALYVNQKIPRRNLIQYIRSNIRLVKFYSQRKLNCKIKQNSFYVSGRWKQEIHFNPKKSTESILLNCIKVVTEINAKAIRSITQSIKSLTV